MVYVYGVMHWELFDENGKLKAFGVSKNLLTTLGDQELAKAYKEDAFTAPVGMTLGTGAGAPAKGDTALGTQIAGSYEALDGGFPTRALAVITYEVTWEAGDATSDGIAEAGLVTDATFPSAGVLVDRALVSPTVDKKAGDTLKITWAITILGA